MNHVVRFDWAMKRLLRDKANFVVLEGFLTVLLDRAIHIKEILESEGNREYELDKFNRVDLLAVDDDGELMLLEIQNERELDYFHRMTYGVSKVITEHISLSQNYKEIRKVYSINIVYFELGQGKDYVYRGRTEFRGLHDHDDVLSLSNRQKEVFKCESPADILPEYYLLRVDGFDKVATTPLDEWVSFLKTGEIPATASAPGLAEAKERLDVMTLSQEDRARYMKDMEDLRYQRSVIETSRIEGRAEGIAEGRAEGRAEGIAEGVAKGIAEGRAKGRAEGRAEGLAEGKKAMARKMLQNGLPMEMVAECADIPIDELRKLIEQ